MPKLTITASAVNGPGTYEVAVFCPHKSYGELLVHADRALRQLIGDEEDDNE